MNKKNAINTGMQKLHSVLNGTQVSLILLSGVFIETAYGADTIEAPSFVNSASASSLQDAGKELNTWIVAFIAVVIALCSIRPGYYFVTGDAQKGYQHSKEILIGGVVSVVLSGIVFAVIKALS